MLLLFLCLVNNGRSNSTVLASGDALALLLKLRPMICVWLIPFPFPIGPGLIAKMRIDDHSLTKRPPILNMGQTIIVEKKGHWASSVL